MEITLSPGLFLLFKCCTLMLASWVHVSNPPGTSSIHVGFIIVKAQWGLLSLHEHNNVRVLCFYVFTLQLPYLIDGDFKISQSNAVSKLIIIHDCV